MPFARSSQSVSFGTELWENKSVNGILAGQQALDTSADFPYSSPIVYTRNVRAQIHQRSGMGVPIWIIVRRRWLGSVLVSVKRRLSDQGPHK